MELKISLSHGNFIPDFAFNKYHGSAVMLVYPYLNLYPIALLSFIIKSKITLIYVYFMINTFILLIISFYSCKNYVQNESTSYIFSILYGLSSVFFAYNFINLDFGVVTSFLALPMIIFGFMNLLHGRNSWIKLSLGMILVAFSHVLNLIIFSLFLLLWLFININHINKKLLIRLFKSIMLFLSIASIIWIPFLGFYINNYNDILIPYSAQLNRSGIKPFLSSIYGNPSVTNIGFFAIITIFIAVAFYNNFNKYIKQIYFLALFITILVLIFPKDLTSHGIFKIFNQIQFTWRLYIIPHILFVFILSLIVTKYIDNCKKRKFLNIIIILLAILLQIKGQYNLIKDISTKPNININSFNKKVPIYPNYKISNSRQLMNLIDMNYEENNDYIPKASLSMSKNVNSIKGLYNDNLISIKNNDNNTLSFKGIQNIKNISLPIYVYNKEELHVYLNGKIVNNYADNNGLLTIDNIQNNIKSNNTIYIKSSLNPFRIIGSIISILGVLFVLIVLIKRKLVNFIT